MFYKMYVANDYRAFMKCLSNDFTVIPFTVFFVKMVRLILEVNYSISNEVVLNYYVHLCLLLVGIKVLMVIIRKVNLLDSPTSLDSSSVKSLKSIDELSKI